MKDDRHQNQKLRSTQASYPFELKAPPTRYSFPTNRTTIEATEGRFSDPGMRDAMRVTLRIDVPGYQSYKVAGDVTREALAYEPQALRRMLLTMLDKVESVEELKRAAMPPIRERHLIYGCWT